MGPTVDGIGWGKFHSASSGGASQQTLTTAHGGEMIVAAIVWDKYSGATGTAVSSVSSTNTTGWMQVGAWSTRGLVGGCDIAYMEIWVGIASAALINETINVTLNGTADSALIVVNGVYDSAGAYTTGGLPYLDPNGSIPASLISYGANSPCSSGGGSPGPDQYADATISTNRTNDLVMAFWANDNGPDVSQQTPSGFTALFPSGAGAGTGTAGIVSNADGALWATMCPSYQTESTALTSDTISMQGGAGITEDWMFVVLAFTSSVNTPSGTWASTDIQDTFGFHEFPNGPWASTEYNDDWFNGPRPQLDTWATGGAGTGGPPTTFSSATVTLSTNHHDEVIVLYSTAGSLNSEGFITSITDTAGLTWHKRQTRLQFGIRPAIEMWWAHAPRKLVGDVITVNYNPGVGAINLYAIGVAGANYTTPWDTHTLSGGTADNFDSGNSFPQYPSNPQATVTTNAVNSLILAMYSSNTVDNDGTVTAPFTFVNSQNHTAQNAGPLYSSFSYYEASARQTGVIAQYGIVGGSANERAVMFDTIIGADNNNGTADFVRWFLDAGFFGGGPAFFQGEFVNNAFFGGPSLITTYNTDDMIIVMACVQSAGGLGEVSSITLGGGGSVSPGFVRRSRVTDASGTLALEVWWAWAAAPLPGTTTITVNCDHVANQDSVTFMVFAVNGGNVPGFSADWDPNTSLPALAFSDTGGKVEVPGINTNNLNTLNIAFTVNTTEDETGFETPPYLPLYNKSSGAPPIFLNMQYYFSAPLVANETAEWSESPGPAVWVAIADAIPVGPPAPPFGTWASTEHPDTFTGAPAQAPYNSIGWLGWVPAFLTMAPTERKDFNTGCPPQFPYLSVGWLGWVPLNFSFFLTDFLDHFTNWHAWVIDHPLTGQWNSTEAVDRISTPWANPPYTHPTW